MSEVPLHPEAGISFPGASRSQDFPEAGLNPKPKTLKCTLPKYHSRVGLCPYSRATPVQGCLAHKEPPLPRDPTVGPCLRSYGGPRGGGRFFLSEVVLSWRHTAQPCTGRTTRGRERVAYRGTSLIRKRLPLGPCSRPMPKALRWS